MFVAVIPQRRSLTESLVAVRSIESVEIVVLSILFPIPPKVCCWDSLKRDIELLGICPQKNDSPRIFFLTIVINVLYSILRLY